MSHSIYSLIHGNLRRMLVMALSVSALLLLIYTVFSFKRTENQAAHFVMNHVERLAQAGVNSQNVGDIDHEIARFAQTWKETQDLDLRIDIFLNEKQISHAGQLQPFNFLSTLTEKKVVLPSGDELRVEIQMDLVGFILYGLCFLVIFEGSVVLLFYILSRSMRQSVKEITKPLEQKIEWIKKIAEDLPKSARTNPYEPVLIDEIDDLGKSIGSLNKQIVALEDNIAKINFDRGRLKMADQVAHSIKGVIATLQLKVSKLPLSSEIERTDLMACINSLGAISIDLLKSKKLKLSGPMPSLPQVPIHLGPVVKTALSIKSEQYADKAGVTFNFANENSASDQFIHMTAANLQNVLFTLIDNSVEALGSRGGNVEIQLNPRDGFVEIIVQDTGRGIPKNIIPQLMTEDFSYEKDDGNGIGLFHAKEVVEGVGGEIEITSDDGIGTRVVVRLPAAKSSIEGQIYALPIVRGSTIVCVDDDSLVHSIWKQRLKDYEDSLGPVVHHLSAAEFEKWMAVNGTANFESTLYLFDFDLRDEKTSGLDLVEKYGIALESILVSGMVSSSEVRERSSKMGVRYLSKEFLDSVPIKIEQSSCREVVSAV